MQIIGAALAGFYAVVATALSSATGDAASPAPGGGTTDIDCAKVPPASSSVSKPNTTVTVTCGDKATIEPSAPEKAANDIYLDANCTEEGKLSSVCPGATVKLSPAALDKGSQVAKAEVFIPQLPASEQVLCLKCSNKEEAPKECKAVINVAAAPLQGPQACAAPGSSIRLQINEAGGSAQFACGNGLTLMPGDATRAYADDCKKEETLKDMTRTPGEGKYVILKAGKLKQKKLCYLCEQSGTAEKTGRKEDPCTVYVEVNGSAEFSSRVGVAVALPCVAAMLRLI